MIRLGRRNATSGVPQELVELPAQVENDAKCFPRAGLLKLVAIWLGGAAALLTGGTKVARANTGGPLILGRSGDTADPNIAESATEVQFDGSGDPSVVFLVQADNKYQPSSASFESAIAGWTSTNQNIPNGVYGYSERPNGHGVVGVADRVDATGVRGVSNAGTGVRGQSGAGTGVLGTTPANLNFPSERNAGVKGLSTAPNGVGVYGEAFGTQGLGVFGRGLAIGVEGIGVTHAGGGITHGVHGVVSAPDGVGVFGHNNAGFGNEGYGVYCNGKFAATGTKAAHVPHPDGSHRALYCMESPQSWFEDFGTGRLVNGSATVRLDPDFAALVHTDGYHVFLTPKGDSKGLYVNGCTATGFTVREQQGGASILAFDYRVVARRKDVAAPRLAKVELPIAPSVAAWHPGGPAPGS